MGKETVYLILITDGSGSKVFDNKRYINLKHEQKVALRNNEFKAAVSRLGLDLSNVVFLNQPESSINNKFIKETTLYFENTFENVTHITHSYNYRYEIHEQHLATGNLINNLYTINYLVIVDSLQGKIKFQALPLRIL